MGDKPPGSPSFTIKTVRGKRYGGLDQPGLSIPEAHVDPEVKAKKQRDVLAPRRARPERHPLLGRKKLAPIDTSRIEWVREQNVRWFALKYEETRAKIKRMLYQAATAHPELYERFMLHMDRLTKESAELPFLAVLGTGMIYQENNRGTRLIKVAVRIGTGESTEFDLPASFFRRGASVLGDEQPSP